MKYLKKFESIYSAAAMIAPKEFSKPVTNNEYIVKRILIKFPDTTELSFDIISENVYSDIKNYTIKPPPGSESLHDHYLKFYGNLIQMSNYQEFVFVRCWNNPQDFIENDWEGYIYREDRDGFYEIQMKFNIDTPNDLMDKPSQPTWTQHHFKNEYCDKYIIRILMHIINIELPNGISYQELIRIKRKFESYLINIEGSSTINLVEKKIDGISLLSIIYSLFLRDNKIFKTFKLDSSTIYNCSVSNLLDTLY